MLLRGVQSQIWTPESENLYQRAVGIDKRKSCDTNTNDDRAEALWPLWTGHSARWI